MKRSSKFKCCGIVSIVIGIILLGVGIGWPFIIDAVVRDQVKDQAALGSDNEDKWKGIPGTFDIQLNRKTYTFGVTNREDVIFNGAVPIVKEYGPFIYREYDDYGGEPLDGWDHEYPLPGGSGKTKKGIRLTFNQYAKYNDGSDYKDLQSKDLDVPIWQINQAALGVWFAATNPPAWRLALNLLYSLVLDGLGRQVVQQGGWTGYSSFLNTESGIKQFLFTNAGITDAQATALLNDPLWGLKSVPNYIRWEPMTYGSDPILQQSLFNELKGRFGLSHEQVAIAQGQWNRYDLFTKGGFISLVPSVGKNAQGVAYAQWANSFVTGNLTDPKTDSVTQASDTVTGYPELSFFFVNKFIPTIGSNQELYTRFKDIKLYVGFGESDVSKNYEYLFDLDDKQGGAPPSTSLFNIQTLQALLAAGDNTIDIVDKPETTGLDLTQFNQVSQLLGLANEQTYLIYLWLKYVKIATFQRAQDKGSTPLGVAGQLTSQALAQQMYTMEHEVPLILYTYQCVAAIGQTPVSTPADCSKFYTGTLGFKQDLADTLCNGGKLQINTFNFQNVQATCKSWMNLALNNNTNNPSDYADFVFLSSLSGAEIDQLLFYSTSKFQSFLQTNIIDPIFKQYPTTCTSNIDKKLCTVRELTYQQWLDQSILSNPPASVPKTTDSYVNAFKDFTTLPLAPELSFYLGKAKLQPFTATLADTMEIMQTNRLFNLEIVGDIILQKAATTYTQAFTNPSMARYVKYVMIELGLNGLFQYRTSREYIEGFVDPLVYQVSQQPVWNGGDQTNNPFMSLNESPTNPKDNPIVFFSGHGDYLQTRTFGRWLDLDWIAMKRVDYKSIYETMTVYQSPWPQQLPVLGTDGFQFHPNLEKDDILTVFVNDIGRSGTFEYYDEDSDSYDGLKMLTYQISPKLMDKSNPDNQVYGTFLDGTTPLFPVLNAPVLATKGHYFQIDKDAQDKIAIILDQQGNKITPTQSEDDIFLGMEQHSGVNVQARQRVQMNFYIKKDLLFDHLQTDYILTPLTFIKRESIMTKSQVRNILGPLYVAKTARVAGLATLISLGGLLILLSIFMFCRFKKIKKNEEYGIFDKNEKQVTAGGYDKMNDINASKQDTFLGNSSSRDN